MASLYLTASEGEEEGSIAVEDIEHATGIQVSDNDMLMSSSTLIPSHIQEKYSISCVCNSTVSHLGRLMRNSLSDLLEGEEGAEDMEAMRQAVARTYSRDKVQFNPEQEDTMVVQASALIDDVDKELNNYVMRCREWYGWHFPELGKLVPDSVSYAKVGSLRWFGLFTR
jgi:nucleolar protein 58